jgi:regulator of sigma E protease
VFLAFGYGDTDIDTSSIKDGYTVTNPILTNLGLKTGDNIVSINGEKVTMYSEIRKKLIEAETLTVLRNNETKQITLPEDFLGQLSTGDSRSFFGLRTPFVINNVVDTLANKDKDLKTGDIVVAINNEPLKYFDQLADRIKPFSGGEVSVDILRDGQTIPMQLNVDTDGKLGLQSGGSLEDVEQLGYYDIVRKEYGLGESVVVGYDKFTETVASYGVQLKKIFTPSTGAYKGVGGFKAIYSIFPAQWSWQAFWALTAFLSIMLGVLNLLPIPVLDGGHVVFLLYEMISGRAPNEKFLERAQLVGFILLIAMVLSANLNDWI